MISNKFRYVLIVAFIILLIIEVITLDYENVWQWKNYIRFSVPILMIIAMIASIRHVNKHGEK